MTTLNAYTAHVVIDNPPTTLALPPGWNATRDRYGQNVELPVWATGLSQAFGLAPYIAAGVLHLPIHKIIPVTAERRETDQWPETLEVLARRARRCVGTVRP